MVGFPINFHFVFALFISFTPSSTAEKKLEFSTKTDPIFNNPRKSKAKSEEEKNLGEVDACEAKKKKDNSFFNTSFLPFQHVNGNIEIIRLGSNLGC